MEIHFVDFIELTLHIKIHCITGEFDGKFHVCRNREAMRAISVFQVKFVMEIGLSGSTFKQ